MAEFRGDLQSMLDAADAMIHTGEVEQVFVLLDRLIVEYPDSPDVSLMLGDAEFDFGNLEASLDSYDRAVEQDPLWPEAFASRARCLVELGRLDEAHNDVLRSLEADPRCVQAHYIRAILLELNEKDSEADDAYRTASNLMPDVYSIPFRVSRRSFDRSVRTAIKRLPARFRDRMRDVDIYVDDMPTRNEDTGPLRSPLVMGEFEGYPITERRVTDPETQIPPKIHLFQKNIERVCASQEDLVREIEITLLHEIGHFFGLDEGDLKRIDLQ